MGALDMLRERYPHEQRVAIWASAYQGPCYPALQFTALIGYDGPIFGTGPTPLEAVISAMKKAGDRDPTKMLRSKIESTRAVLAKLESELASKPPAAADPHSMPFSEPQPATV